MADCTSKPECGCYFTNDNVQWDVVIKFSEEFYGSVFTVIGNRQWNLNSNITRPHDHLTRYLYQWRPAWTEDARDIHYPAMKFMADCAKEKKHVKVTYHWWRTLRHCESLTTENSSNCLSQWSRTDITELSQIEHRRILGRRAINYSDCRHSSTVLLICDFPLKAPPYLRTDNISEPPFRGLFAGFSCLGDPPKSKTLLNLPPIFYFITPFLNFSGVQRERERKTTPFLKKSPGEMSNTPLFFIQFSGRTLSHKKYPFTGDFGNTHAVPPTPEWGGGGGGGVKRELR